MLSSEGGFGAMRIDLIPGVDQDLFDVPPVLSLEIRTAVCQHAWNVFLFGAWGIYLNTISIYKIYFEYNVCKILFLYICKTKISIPRNNVLIVASHENAMLAIFKFCDVPVFLMFVVETLRVSCGEPLVRYVSLGFLLLVATSCCWLLLVAPSCFWNSTRNRTRGPSS